MTSLWERFWQHTIPTDPPTTVWLEHPGKPEQHFSIEQGGTRRTQVAEPTASEFFSLAPGAEICSY